MWKNIKDEQPKTEELVLVCNGFRNFGLRFIDSFGFWYDEMNNIDDLGHDVLYWIDIPEID